MIRLCCGQEHTGVICPDGLVMCCLCFDRFPQDALAVDSDGLKWDVCAPCYRDDQVATLRARG